MRIKVIGLGGIGGHLIESLMRFLTYSSKDDNVICLVDGDAYEAKNQSRQTFHREGNKAEVTAENMLILFPHLAIEYIPEYVNEMNIADILLNGEIIFLGVDNHTTRRLVSEYCERLDNIVLISGGNDYTSGNVQIHIRVDGENKTPAITKYHDEIAIAEGDHPDELGCEAAMFSAPQLIFMNQIIAAYMLTTFYNFIERQLTYNEIFADIKTGNTRTVRQAP